ncbi:hypothetical protein V492_03435 [Pseudogymnoascus sp. VKM F-4246]|nr:hypothetical protein V492_03435 [Pseudogymnoascus sp. VKM F-4246]
MTYDSDTPILLGEMEPPTPVQPAGAEPVSGKRNREKVPGKISKDICQGAKRTEAVCGAGGSERPTSAPSQIVNFLLYRRSQRSTPHPHTTRSPASIKANTVKMVVMYNIAGRQIASHWLSIATLSLTFGGAALAMGGKKAEKTSTPPLNAKNNDEEKFIKDFLADIDSSEKKGQKA